MLQSNFIEITLKHGFSPVNLLHIFRTLFPKNTSGGLLLNAMFLRVSKKPYALSTGILTETFFKKQNEVN